MSICSCIKKKKEPKWLKIAKKEIGEKEVPGRGNNPRIVEYHDYTTLDASADSVPWCAAFVAFCLENAGVRSTRKPNARSYEHWGKNVSIDDTRAGDVAVFWRGKKDGWKGHVAFVLGYNKNSKLLKIVGGNQTDAVTIEQRTAKQLLTIRRV